MTLVRGFYIPTTPAPRRQIPEVEEALRKEKELRHQKMEAKRLDLEDSRQNFETWPLSFWESILVSNLQ